MHIEVARGIVDAALQEAERRGLALSVVVADASGHLVAAARMDGARFGTMEVALDKAYSAAAFAAPTSRWGAVGASGAAAEDDERCAAAGISAAGLDTVLE